MFGKKIDSCYFTNKLGDNLFVHQFEMHTTHEAKQSKCVAAGQETWFNKKINIDQLKVEEFRFTVEKGQYITLFKPSRTGVSTFNCT